MSKQHILVCGYGPGIGHAVAVRFGQAGFHVSIVGRNETRLRDATSDLSKQGISAAYIRADLGSASDVREAVAAARERGGPVTTVHWNAVYPGAGDLLTATVEELESIATLGLIGPVLTVREALDDLRRAEAGAVLFTGGGLASDPGDQLAHDYGMAGIAIGKALHRKCTRLLDRALADSSVYVGELAVLGMVRGASNPAGDIDPSAVAEQLFEMQRIRSDVHNRILPEG